MTTYDPEAHWTCANSECSVFAEDLKSTTLQTRDYEKYGVEPECPECKKPMKFVAWWDTHTDCPITW